MIDQVVRNANMHLLNEVQFLCFLLDDSKQIYATNVFKIREVVHYRDIITRTEGDDNDVVIGFINMRGESIPLLDLKRWLYFNPSEPNRDLLPYSVVSPKYLVAICNFSGYTVGLRIYEVRRIIQRNWEEVVTGSEYGFDKNGKVIATTKFDDGSIVQILDVEKMLGEVFPMIDEFEALSMQQVSFIRSNKIILLAEDSVPINRSMQGILEKLGLSYFSFANGKELLDYLSHKGTRVEDIGAIITDLEMPIASGFEVLRRVKDSEVWGNIPVIINTSMSSESNIATANSLKADAFITKISPIEIEMELRKILEKAYIQGK